ncbi:MAG: thiosulfate oxidation carrier complex protein SoxZ [Thiohalocapsa sp.]|jgi:sulfur-oxidizing protein SoxZ
MSNDHGRIRAKAKNGGVAVRVLINHPMETGSREHPSTGDVIPRHYIQEVICEHNGAVVLSLDWGWGISANPYLAFHIQQGQVGDTVVIRWIDDQGETASLETQAA